MLGMAQTEVHQGPVNLPSYKSLKYPPLPPLKVPTPVEFTLSNGIKVFLLEDHELPLIDAVEPARLQNKIFRYATVKDTDSATNHSLRFAGTGRLCRCGWFC